MPDNTLTQATLGNRPLYKTGVLNGKSVARFDATDDYLTATAFSKAQPLTVFAVVKRTGQAGHRAIFDGVDASNNTTMWKTSGGVWAFHAGTSQTDGTSDTATHVMAGVFNGANSALYEDGNTRLSGVNVGANGLLTGIRLGADRAAAAPFDGDMGEVIVFDRVLTVAEMNLVGQYLATKWGTTWAPIFAGVSAAAALTGTGSLSASGVVTKKAAAALSGTGTLSVATSKRFVRGVAALTGTGSLVAGVKRSTKVAAALTGVGSLLVATVKRTVKVAAALTGTGDLFANGDVTGGTKTAAANLSGLGTLTATGKAVHYAQASLTGTGTLSAVGKAKKYGAANLAGTGTLLGGARRVYLAKAVLSGSGTLVGRLKGTVRTQALLTGIGNIVASGLIAGEGPPEYRLDLHDLAGTLVRSDLMTMDLGQELIYAYALNGPGAMTFTLPSNRAGVTPENYLVGQRTLKLYRNDILVWAGYLLGAEGNRDMVSFSALGWYEGLRRRLIDQNFHFYSIEALDIAWQLIAYTQSKTTLGITRDPTEVASGRNRSRDYCCDDFTLVSEAIEDLAGLYWGFDFWVTPDKVWKTASPRRGSDRTSSIIFDAQKNTSEMSYALSAEDMATEVFYVGPNPDECRDIESMAQNIATYGRHELGVDMTNMKSMADRDERATEMLRYQSVPLRQVNLVAPSSLGIRPLSFDLGDRVRVKSSNGWMTFDQTMRVIDFAVAVGLDCVEDTTVTADSVYA